MNTAKRHQKIKDLIESGKYKDQNKLLATLNKRGFNTTQATLSRDLRKIGAIKREGKYTLEPIGYALNGFSKVITMKFVHPNMIVLRTTPGLAQSASHLIDQAEIRGIEGTVAGDDTIFVAIETPKIHSRIINTLIDLFNRSRRHS